VSAILCSRQPGERWRTMVLNSRTRSCVAEERRAQFTTCAILLLLFYSGNCSIYVTREQNVLGQETECNTVIEWIPDIRNNFKSIIQLTKRWRCFKKLLRRVLISSFCNQEQSIGEISWHESVNQKFAKDLWRLTSFSQRFVMSNWFFSSCNND